LRVATLKSPIDRYWSAPKMAQSTNNAHTNSQESAVCRLFLVHAMIAGAVFFIGSPTPLRYARARPNWRPAR
jgi:hypothetical protein